MKTILKLYPKVYAEALEFGEDDSEVISEIMCAVSHFFLSCEWPNYGNKCDMKIFSETLNTEINRYEEVV